MSQESTDQKFQSINRGYNGVFRSGRLSIGLVVPLESYQHGPVPTMREHIVRIQLAESLGLRQSG